MQRETLKEFRKKTAFRAYFVPHIVYYRLQVPILYITFWDTHDNVSTNVQKNKRDLLSVVLIYFPDLSLQL